MVAQVARQAADRVTIVGVASRDTEEAMTEFVQRHGLEHVEHVADVDQVVWQRNGVAGQPAWVLVDAETGQTATHFGSFDRAGLEAAIDSLDS